MTDQRPKVMPHPALIARYVEDLRTTLDTDVPKARAILMRVLRPFTITPDGDGYRISGALANTASIAAVMFDGRLQQRNFTGGACGSWSPVGANEPLRPGTPVRAP